MSSVLKNVQNGQKEQNWFASRGITPGPNTQFFPVLEMIANPTSVISVFFDTSLKSWVLLLRVQPGNSMYANFSDVEQTEFLLKISVITRENDQTLPAYKVFTKKQSESEASFTEEAERQQIMSMDSSRYNSDEICPPVTSYALFGYDPAASATSTGKAAAATSFLSVLKNKVISQRSIPMSPDELYKSEDVKHVVDYLRILVMRHRFKVLPFTPEITILGLGVIVMPREVNSITVSDFIKNLGGAPIPYEVFAQQAASLLQLVIKQKVIPFDLHGKNQLIDDKLSVKIIDFGRSVGVKPGDVGDEDFLTTQQKQEVYNEITKLHGYEPQLNGLERTVDTRGPYDSKNVGQAKICQTILEILLWIKSIELAGVSRRFGRSNPSSKMTFIEQIEQMNPTDKCLTLYTAFKIFISSNAINDKTITQGRIRELIGENRLVGFGRANPLVFYCHIPQTIGPFTMETTEPPDTNVTSRQGGPPSRYIDSSVSATVVDAGPQLANMSSSTQLMPQAFTQGPQLANLSSSQFSTPAFAQVQNPGQQVFAQDQGTSTFWRNFNQSSKDQGSGKGFGGSYKTRNKIKTKRRLKLYRNLAPKYVKNRTKYLTSKRKRKTRKTKNK
jgi:hypothetical protein